MTPKPIFITLKKPLASVADLAAAIERDSAGNPTAIVSPYGQRTSLAVDGNGFLARG